MFNRLKNFKFVLVKKKIPKKSTFSSKMKGKIYINRILILKWYSLISRIIFFDYFLKWFLLKLIKYVKVELKKKLSYEKFNEKKKETLCASKTNPLTSNIVINIWLLVFFNNFVVIYKMY